MYVQVNIGRNIGTEPMSETMWDTFAGKVAFAIYEAANCYEAFDVIDNVELHDGIGKWNGKVEDSRHISSFWEDGFDLVQLRRKLSDIAKDYSQETIALITGSDLVSADEKYQCDCGLYYATGIPESHKKICWK